MNNFLLLLKSWDLLVHHHQFLILLNEISIKRLYELTQGLEFAVHFVNIISKREKGLSLIQVRVVVLLTDILIEKRITSI